MQQQVRLYPRSGQFRRGGFAFGIEFALGDPQPGETTFPDSSAPPGSRRAARESSLLREDALQTSARLPAIARCRRCCRADNCRDAGECAAYVPG